MKIIYFTWKEITENDLYDALQESLSEVIKCSYEIKSYIDDPVFFARFEELIKKENPDGIITFNFLPIISKIALRNKLPYISWIYDSPCLTMYSEMIFNPYNYLFHFDSFEVERIRKLGVKNIWHMPLAVNVKRVDNLIGQTDNVSDRVKCRISFMGNLYTDEYDYLGNIKGLPDRLKGYLEAVVDAGCQVMSGELTDTLLNDEFMKQLSPYVSFSKEAEFFIDDRTMLSEIIKKRISMLERIELVKRATAYEGFKLFTNSDCSCIDGVESQGIIDYYREMPLLFNNCAVNLNITLRNIAAGIPLRVMDICGAGGFVLSSYTWDMAYAFGTDEIGFYYDRRDFCEKLKYYLLHEDERMNMAERANERIRRDYTYEVRLGKILDTVFKTC